MNIENIEDIYELSPMQQGMLFHSLESPGSEVYCVRVCYTLKGDINVPALQSAWQHVIDRHPALRTSYYWEDLKKPLQVVHRRVLLPMEKHDWRGFEPTDREEKLEDLIREEGSRGFDLREAPLMRLILIRWSDDIWKFIISQHHIILDGWCKLYLFTEVFSFYEAICEDRNIHIDMPRPYRDYIIWLQNKDLKEAEMFWRSELKGFNAPTPLGIDRVSGDMSGLKKDYDHRHMELSRESTFALLSLSRKSRITPNTFVQGAWAILLSHYSGKDDVVFGATVSGRPAELEGVMSMIGLFINTLPVRVHILRDHNILPWLMEIQKHQALTRQYDYSPLVNIHGWSDVPRSRPLFESIVVFENTTGFNSSQEKYGNIDIINIRPFIRNNYPITVRAVPGPNMSLDILYHFNRFNTDTVERISLDLLTLLESIITQPDVKLRTLEDILDENNRKRKRLKEEKSKEAGFMRLMNVKRRVVRG